MKRKGLTPPTDAANVVKNILGIDETELAKLSKDNPAEFAKFLIVEKDEQGREIMYLKNPKDPKAKRVCVGNYSQPTMADLNARVEARKKALAGQPPKGTSFSIIYGTGEEGLKHVDTANMQADPAYKNAMFMVASNFSGLETLDKDDTQPGGVKPISSYVWDKTQGPAAATSAVAAGLRTD